MSQEGLQKLMERANGEPSFRAALRDNAEQAVREAGIDLTDEERLQLQTVDWSLTSEQHTIDTIESKTGR